MDYLTVYDRAHKRLRKLDSFDANLNSTKRKLDFTKRKLDSFGANLIPQNACKLDSTKRKLDSSKRKLDLTKRKFDSFDANLNSTKRELEFRINFEKSKHET